MILKELCQMKDFTRRKEQEQRSYTRGKQNKIKTCFLLQYYFSLGQGRGL